jgi:hypothetical protein
MEARRTERYANLATQNHDRVSVQHLPVALSIVCTQDCLLVKICLHSSLRRLYPSSLPSTTETCDKFLGDIKRGRSM